MKKSLFVFSCLILLAFSGSAQAATYGFEDMIDTWGYIGPFPIDAVHIDGTPFVYTHDLNQEVDFARGDKVLDATLELDFTNDSTDDYGSTLFGLIRWDHREYARVGFDGSAWQNIGEVDNGQYDIVLDIDWLNDDGFLDVSIKATNNLGTASAWLDHSRLFGTAEAVPEPGTMILLGSGLLAIGLVGRKFRR